jgi:predicted chitinase
MAPRYRYRLGWRSLGSVVAEAHYSKAQLQDLSVVLAEAMREYGITSRRASAMFIAQVAHESDFFHAREEYASGAAYEGRRDLGNTHPGDGKRYKGRSFIQITGRANYRALPHWDGIDFEKHPEKLAEPKYAALAAAWWFAEHGLVRSSNAGASVEAVTRVINGGYNGLAQRKLFYRRASRASLFLTPKRRKP